MSKFFQTIANLSAVVCCIGISSLFAPESAKAARTKAPHAVMQQGLADGIYKVTFAAPDGKNGLGIVVISGGTVNGGDQAYTYQGHIEMADGKLKAVIAVDRHSQGDSIFGPLDNFQLNLEGSVQNSGTAFSAVGAVPDKPKLSITLSGGQVRPLR